MVICSASDCTTEASCKGMCHKHYKRFIRHGDASKTKNHGMALTKEYLVWKTIRARCLNPNNADYKHYGGRGITVDVTWVTSFETFLNDIGKATSELHQIDRIDNNKGYEKGNCRWVTASVNNRNKRNTKITRTVLEDLRVSTLTNKELASNYGVCLSSIIATRRKISQGLL